MKNVLTYCLVLFWSIILISCNTNDPSTEVGTGNSPKTEEELKQELFLKECKQATSYLTGTLSTEPIYKNLLSMKVKGMKLKCVIKNTATLATLKDINAQVVFKSKTGATVLTKTFDIYEFISPNSSYTYKTEISISNQQWKDIENFEWTIVEASCK